MLEVLRSLCSPLCFAYESKENNTQQLISEPHPPGTYPEPVMMTVAVGRALPLLTQPSTTSSFQLRQQIIAWGRASPAAHVGATPAPTSSCLLAACTAAFLGYQAGQCPVPVSPSPAAGLRGTWKISARLTTASVISGLSGLVAVLCHGCHLPAARPCCFCSSQQHRVPCKQAAASRGLMQWWPGACRNRKAPRLSSPPRAGDAELLLSMFPGSCHREKIP